MIIYRVSTRYPAILRLALKAGLVGQLAFSVAHAQNSDSPSNPYAPRPTWRIVDRPKFVQWQPVSEERPKPIVAEDKYLTDPWIFGVGGGARIGVGEPTYPQLYARVGRRISPEMAISLRPRYIFGNSDLEGQANDQNAFQMPLTLDIQPDSWISPYVGGGIATATDSVGGVNAMFNGGVDIKFGSNIRLDLGMAYIIQPVEIDIDQSDIEMTASLYFLF